MPIDELGLVAVAWRYRYKTDRTGDEWDDWISVAVDPNDWDWAPAWHDFEAQPLYSAAAIERLLAERDEARGDLAYAKQALDLETARSIKVSHRLVSATEALTGMVRRFELYAGPNDMHAGNHDLALLNLARQALEDSKT